MQFFCPGCGTKHIKSESEIPDGGTTVVCEKCGFEIFVDKPKTDKQPAAKHKEQTAPAPQKSSKKIFFGNLLQNIGTGRSENKFRFRVRDLCYALVVPLDYRKLLCVGALVFVANLLYAGLLYLGSLTESNTGITILTIIGGILFWVLVMMALGITSHLTDLELTEGKQFPIIDSIKFALSSPLKVLGTPLIFVAIFLLLSIGVALLSVIGRIPYAGPLVYGMTFVAVFAMSFFAVLVYIIFGLLAFSYLPAVVHEGLNPIAGAKRMLSLIRENLGRYLLHLLIASLCAFGLLIVLQFIIALTMAHLGWVGAKAMGPEDLGMIFLGVPKALFGILTTTIPQHVLSMFSYASEIGWQFNVAGWMIGLTLLAVFSLVLAFVLVYFFGAGVINYHLLVAKEKQQQKS